MASNLFNLILGFFFWVISARYYSPHDIGIVTALISSMQLISMISGLGFQTAFVFYLPRDLKNSNRIINSGITSSIAASLIFSFLFIIGIDIWAPPLKSVIYNLEFSIFFATVTAATIVSGHISSAYIAGRRSSFHLSKEMIFGLVKILPIPMLSVLGAIGIFMAFGIGMLISVVIGFMLLSLVWKGYSPGLMIHPVIKNMMVYSVGNFFAEIFYSLPRYLLPIMIVNLLSAESTGFFYIAMMLATLLYGIPQAISNSLLAESSDSGELWLKVKKSIKLNVAILLPGILLFIFSGKFLLDLFDPTYSVNSSDTLIILVLASLPISLNIIFTTIRNAQKRVSSVVMINAAISVITLVLALPLIRILDIEGAAIAYLAANTLIATILVYKMRNITGNYLKSTK